jgi:hypothetical protein
MATPVGPVSTKGENWTTGNAARTIVVDGAAESSSTATRVRNFKLRENQAKSVNAAIEKMKKTTNTRDDSAALVAICRDYVGGPTLQERFVGLANR